MLNTRKQTGTGSIVVPLFPGTIETKPCSATAFFGVEPAILDPVKGKELKGYDVQGVIIFKTLWPSIACTVYKDHKHYLDTYMNVCFAFLTLVQADPAKAILWYLLYWRWSGA